MTVTNPPTEPESDYECGHPPYALYAAITTGTVWCGFCGTQQEPERCQPKRGIHSTPHKGCLLR